MFKTHTVALSDDLSAICEQMQPSKWGTDNEMTSYTTDNLRKFLHDDNILLLAYDGSTIAGAAIAHELTHPAGENSLYVHELDTHPDYRRQGVSTAIMHEFIKIAKARKLNEVWVGTETTNKVANKFYKSLKPNEIEPSNIYSYKN